MLAWREFVENFLPNDRHGLQMANSGDALTLGTLALGSRSLPCARLAFI
jgi:hypothetical protein